MSDVPDDIFAAAFAVISEIQMRHISGPLVGWDADGTIGAVAAAIMAERERCAKIADSFTCGSCGMDGKAGAAIRELDRNKL